MILYVPSIIINEKGAPKSMFPFWLSYQASLKTDALKRLQQKKIPLF